MGHGANLALLEQIDRRFGGNHVLPARFDLDKTEDVLFPSDQVDFTAAAGAAPIARHHDESPAAQPKVGFDFAAPSGAQMPGRIFLPLPRQGARQCVNPSQYELQQTSRHERREYIIAGPLCIHILSGC